MSRYIKAIKKILQLLTKQQIMLYFIILLMALIAAGLETLGVSIIIPLANLFVQPNMLQENKYILSVASILNIRTESGITLLVIAGVIFVYLFKNVYLILYSWAKNKYAFKVQRELSVDMVKSYMNRGYSYFTHHNYAEMNQGINGDIFNIYYVIIGLTNAITQFVIICSICVFLCYSDWKLALFVMLSVVICLLLIVFVFRKKMQKSGLKVRHYSIITNQKFKEMVLGIKEVIAMRKQKYYVELYERLTNKRQKYEIIQNVGAEIPSNIIEAICVTGIMIIIGIRMCTVETNDLFISSLAAFAVGAFKILPSVSTISVSLNLVSSTSASLDAVYDNIVEARKINWESDNKVIRDIDNCIFSKEISICNLKFSYDESRNPILNNINISIKKGSSVAFIGESGAGKSTLADIILGLYKPNEGNVMMDGISVHDIPDLWAKIVGFVPQSIYLSDTSILENVAFGEKIENLNKDYVIECLKRARIYDFVKVLPDGVYTEVGESGTRLSGGQRQRIGIARALYHKPEILILDEATSALDNDTENLVMEAVESLHGEMTLIIIAHRLSTVKNCDKIYEIVNGKAIEKLYSELV